MIEGKEFIQIASRWAVLPGSQEPTWRSSISRAYYGAFHHCVEFLTDDLGLDVPSRRDAHKDIPLALEYSKHQPLKLASSKLSGLGQWRRKADYDLKDDSAGKLKLTIEAIEIAKEIECLIDSCKGIAGLNAIQTNIAANFNVGFYPLNKWSIRVRLA